MQDFLVNDENTSEVSVDQTPAIICADGDLAESLLPHLLIVLVEHIEKVLLNFI
jgi:hypothetical protein